MRSVDTYRHPDEYKQDKANFDALYYYMQQTDPEGCDEWFDSEAVDKYVHSVSNPHYNNELFGTRRSEKISTTRVPTRCKKCSRPWAIEYMNSSFEENYLDEGLYANIPLVKGDCKECREKE